MPRKNADRRYYPTAWLRLSNDRSICAIETSVPLTKEDAEVASQQLVEEIPKLCDWLPVSWNDKKTGEQINTAHIVSVYTLAPATKDDMRYAYIAL